MTDRVDLDEIERLEQAATPGPWKQDRNWYITGPDNDWDEHWGSERVGRDLAKFNPRFDQRVCHVNGPPGGCNSPDADFALIAAARNALPGMIRELREARSVLERLADSQGDLDEIRASVETLGLALVQQTHGHKVQYERAQKAERELREARELLGATADEWERARLAFDRNDSRWASCVEQARLIRAHLAKHTAKEADRAD